MDESTLGLSLLNGDLKAVVIRKESAVPEACECGGVGGEELSGLGAALLALAGKTRATGQPVALAFAHPRMNDQVMEVPRVKGWKLERLVGRRAETTKAFPGPAAWNFQSALPTQRGGAVLLHLCPKTLVEQLTRDCHAADLQLVRVLPTTAILLNHLKSLPLAKDELALLAAETGLVTTLVVGRKDGLVCVARVVNSSWNLEPDRLGVDLSRSIGFAEQQSGLKVSSVWLYGAGAREQLARMESSLKLPVKLSPVAYSPVYWAEQAVNMPAREDGNLISPETHAAPSRERFRLVTGGLLCLLAVLALCAAGGVEVMRHRQLLIVGMLQGKLMGLHSQQGALKETVNELEQMKAMIKALGGEAAPPVPAWLLGYLGEITPDGLYLTQLHISRSNEVWHVSLAGGAEPGTNQPAAFRAGYAALTNNLAHGPFHLALTKATLTRTAESAPVARKDQADEDDQADKGPDTFALEGLTR